MTVAEKHLQQVEDKEVDLPEGCTFHPETSQSAWYQEDFKRIVGKELEALGETPSGEDGNARLYRQWAEKMARDGYQFGEEGGHRAARQVSFILPLHFTRILLTI